MSARAPRGLHAPPALDLRMNQTDLQSASRLHQAGQLDQAEAIYKKLLAQQPGNADALHLLGVIRIQRSQFIEAVDLIRQAIALQPNSPGYYSNLGWALTHAGQLNDAVACYRKLCAMQPGNVAAFDSLGRLLLHLGRIDEAIAASAAAVKLRPDVSQYHLSLGHAFSQKHQHEFATRAYREAARLDPQNGLTWYNLGVSLAERGEIPEAIEVLDKAIELKPEFSWSYSTKGAALSQARRFDEAKISLRRALELDPNSPAALNNLANIVQEEGNWEESLALYRRAVALEPKPTARWNLARALLILGHLKEGWAHFDSRLEIPRLNLKRSFTQPQWDGSNPTGKTILLHAEGGHGDAIQFIRLAPQVRERGAKLILECQPALVPLLNKIPEFDRVIARGQPLPDFDWQIPLQGLPHILGITLENIPSRVPYLIPPADRVQKWADRFVHETKLRVGLVWSGSRYSTFDSRSRTIDVFAPLAAIPGIKFFNLQSGEDSRQPPPPAMDWADFSADLTDFAEAAAMVHNLDLVVTIDTAVAHLAGALAKPVWVLIPFQTDFRWLLHRTDSPWYPTMRLFRQTKSGDWSAPLAEMTEALRSFKRP
jgi:Flp pilus assembly protein TadD